MLSLFKKKVLNCEGCNQSLEKTYHIFDASHHRENKIGEKLKLCTDCLMTKYNECLKNFQHHAVIIEPFIRKNFHAYQYYTFDDMLNFGWSQETVTEARSLICHDGTCRQCRTATVFILCSPQVYFHDPYEFHINPQHKGVSLCADCISRRLKTIIERDHLAFSEILPPMRADGVATSFEG